RYGGIASERNDRMDFRPNRTPAAAASRRAAALARLGGWGRSYPGSAITLAGGWLLAGRRGLERQVAVGFPVGKKPGWAAALEGRAVALDGDDVLLLDGTHETLAALREALPFLQPRPTGKTPSFGFGDRTGLATPGHLLALKGSGFFPNLAQQSIREMTRTQRSPAEVLDAAAFGVLQSGHLAGL